MPKRGWKPPAGPERAASWPLTTTLPRAVLERETPADMIVNNFAELTDLGALLA